MDLPAEHRRRDFAAALVVDADRVILRQVRKRHPVLHGHVLARADSGESMHAERTRYRTPGRLTLQRRQDGSGYKQPPVLNITSCLTGVELHEARPCIHLDGSDTNARLGETVDRGTVSLSVKVRHLLSQADYFC